MADPPGTIALISYQDSTDRSQMQLWPQPANDPNDPLNWPTWRKCLNYALVTAMTVAAFTLVQLIFWQQMAVDMKLEIQQLSKGQSVQLAGLASGCIFFIPLAVKYGLRPTYLLSGLLLMAVTWWTARMETYAELILTNYLTGLAGAVNETTVQMTISDLFFVHQRGRANAVYFVAVMVGSFLTPMAAGVEAAKHGWRYSYMCLGIAFTLLAAVYVVAFEETKYVRKPTVGVVDLAVDDPRPRGGEPVKNDDADKKDDTLDMDQMTRTKSNALGEVTPPPNTYRQRMRLLTPTGESWLKLFIAPLYTLAFPHVWFTALQFASGVCWLVLMLSAFSVIFSAPPYNFTTAGVGYMAIGPFIGNIFGSLYGGPLSDLSIRWLARRNGGVFEPEMRLYILMPPTLILSAGLIVFGFTAGEGMHWIYPSIGGAMFAFGLGSYGDIAFTFVIDTYRDLVAQAFVVVAFFRNAISIVIGLVLTPWIQAMGIKYLFVTAGCISLAISLLHIPMILWGKRIRIALAPRHDMLVEKFAAQRATNF